MKFLKIILIVGLLLNGCFPPVLPTFEKFDVRRDNDTVVMGCEKLIVCLGEGVELKTVCKIMDCDTGLAPLVRKMLGIYEDVQRVAEVDYEMSGNEKIVIYKDYKTLHRAFRKLYSKPDMDIVAFYSGRLDAVFVSLDYAPPSVIAHEMTHMLVDISNTDMTKDDEEILAMKVELTVADWYGE